MVYYEETDLEYSLVNMYTNNNNRTSYTPTGSAQIPGNSIVYGSSPPLATAVTTYETSSIGQYQPNITINSDQLSYYDTNYRQYWAHGKEDLAAYPNPGSWAATQNNLYQESALPYKTDYYNQQMLNGGLAAHHQQPYQPCAMMSPHQNMMVQNGLEEEMLKERHNHGYGWIQSGPPSSNNCKTRTKDKYRVVYTDHQRLELEKEFHYSRYITIRRKAELALTLNLSERQVKIWFQNRRAKERKINKKKNKEDGKLSSTDAESRGSPSSSTANEMLSSPSNSNL